MNIVIFGKNGQVGFELRRALAPLGTIFAFSSKQCNLADSKQILTILQQYKPDIIVNAAAYTAVDKAESDAANAWAINASALHTLAEYALANLAFLLHYSTDYVFSGDKNSAYSEIDPTLPLGVYGASKLAGEQAIITKLSQYLILRTSWVYGVHGNNFPKTMLRLSAEREQLSVVADQFGTPTSASLIADVSAHLLKEYQKFRLNNAAMQFPSGLYHLTANGRTNWHEYASLVIASAIDFGHQARVKVENIQAISTEQFPTAAKRPINSQLNCDKLQNTFALNLPPWQEGVKYFLEQLY